MRLQLVQPSFSISILNLKFVLRQLEERLHMSLSIGEQTSKNYEVDKTVWKRTEATLEGKIEKLTHKYNEAKQEVVDHEKVVTDIDFLIRAQHIKQSNNHCQCSMHRCKKLF